MARASSPIKKSRSSTPRLDARWPGALGTGGAREDVDADPRVAIAVGKTLCFVVFSSCENQSWLQEKTYKEGSEFPAKLKDNVLILFQDRPKIK